MLCCDEPCTPASHYSAHYLPAFNSFLLTSTISSSLGLIRLTQTGFVVEDTTDEPNCSVPMNEDFESEHVLQMTCYWEEEKEVVLYWMESGLLYSCMVTMDGAVRCNEGKECDEWREEEKEEVEEYKKKICEWEAKEEAFNAFYTRLRAQPFESLEEEAKIDLMLEESQLREEMVSAMMGLKAELVAYRHSSMCLLQRIGDEAGHLARVVKPAMPYRMDETKKDLPRLLEAVKYLMSCRDLTKETTSEEEKEE